MAISTVRIYRHIPQMAAQEFPGQKFIALRDALRDEESVGFISDATGQAYVQDLYQAQHALAPTIVFEGESPRFTIVTTSNHVSLIKKN